MGENYVREDKNAIFCTAPDCEYAIDGSTFNDKFLKCKCGHQFCAKCSEDGNHLPATC